MLAPTKQVKPCSLPQQVKPCSLGSGSVFLRPAEPAGNNVHRCEDFLTDNCSGEDQNLTVSALYAPYKIDNGTLRITDHPQVLALTKRRQAIACRLLLRPSGWSTAQIAPETYLPGCPGRQLTFSIRIAEKHPIPFEKE